jgi:hypothetical protein
MFISTRKMGSSVGVATLVPILEKTSKHTLSEAIIGIIIIIKDEVTVTRATRRTVI